MGGGRTESIIDELLSDGEKFATESKQTTANSLLGGMAGAGAVGTKALAVADTWYAVPSTVPAANFVLVVSKENALGTIRWAFTNTGTPSVTNGNKMSSDDIIFELASGQVVYCASTVAGDDINWTTKIM